MAKENGVPTPENQEQHIRFAPPITAEELLEKSVEEARGLHLGKSSIYLSSKTGPDYTEYTGLVMERMGLPQFNRFLFTVAPNPRFGLSVRELVDDLHMPNRKEAWMVDLHNEHKQALGEKWSTFLKSWPLILNTLNLDPYALPWQKTSRHFLTLLDIQDASMDEFKENVLGPESPAELTVEFKRLLQEIPFFARKRWVKNDEPAEVTRRFLTFDHWQHDDAFHKFIARVFEGRNEVVRQHVVDAYASLGIGGRQMRSLPNGNIGIEIYDLFSTEVTFGRGKAGRMRWDPVEDTISSVNFLVPTIRWRRKEDGTREGVFDFLEGEEASHFRALLDRVPDNLTFDSRRFNPVVGFGIVPYFLREVKDGLPKYQKFVKDSDNYRVVPAQEGESRAQFMGTQAALIVFMQHQEHIFTKGQDFFERAEEYVEKHAA